MCDTLGSPAASSLGGLEENDAFRLLQLTYRVFFVRSFVLDRPSSDKTEHVRPREKGETHPSCQSLERLSQHRLTQCILARARPSLQVLLLLLFPFQLSWLFSILLLENVIADDDDDYRPPPPRETFTWSSSSSSCGRKKLRYILSTGLHAATTVTTTTTTGEPERHSFRPIKLVFHSAFGNGSAIKYPVCGRAKSQKMSAQVADASTHSYYMPFTCEKKKKKKKPTRTRPTNFSFFTIFSGRSCWGRPLEAYRVTHMA